MHVPAINDWPLESRKFCFYCGDLMLDPKLNQTHMKRITRDHLTPRSKGGTNDRNNIVLACFACNKDKGIKSLEQYKDRILGTRRRKFPGELRNILSVN